MYGLYCARSDVENLIVRERLPFRLDASVLAHARTTILFEDASRRRVARLGNQEQCGTPLRMKVSSVCRWMPASGCQPPN